MLYSYRISRVFNENRFSIAGFDPSSVQAFRGISIPFILSVSMVLQRQPPLSSRSVRRSGCSSRVLWCVQGDLATVQESISVDGIKIGVLLNEQYVEALSNYLPEYPEIPVVVIL